MANISLTTICYAALGGMVPTFLWLWFWLTEEDDHKEPVLLVILTFLGGAVGVLLLLPLKPLIQSIALTPQTITVLYAFLEEVIKYSLVVLIAFNSGAITRATDYTIFLVTGALGFSALENTLYLIKPIAANTDLGLILITGNMRFLGATVLHSISVALIGVLIGLAYAGRSSLRALYTIIGLILATGLHTVFNYFIMQDTRQSTIIAISGVWIVAVIVILLFDRLRSFEANIQETYQGPSLSS
jgi:RsiW-degrading membrane proteinase PrsW (M82 family)